MIEEGSAKDLSIVVENAKLPKGLSLLLRKTIVSLLSTGCKQSCAKKM